jgi:hypothetical protein
MSLFFILIASKQIVGFFPLTSTSLIGDRKFEGTQKERNEEVGFFRHKMFF